MSLKLHVQWTFKLALYFMFERKCFQVSTSFIPEFWQVMCKNRKIFHG